MATAKIDNCFSGFPTGEFKKVEKAVASLAKGRKELPEDYVKAVTGLLNSNRKLLDKINAELAQLKGEAAPQPETQTPPATTTSEEAATAQPPQSAPKEDKAPAEATPPKQTVETKVKEKAKAEKAKKAAPPAEIKSAKVPQQEVIELWEDNDDGKAAHVPWAELTNTLKNRWQTAVEDGYATIELHDDIVKLQKQNKRADKAQQIAEAAKKQIEDGSVFRVQQPVKGMLSADVEAAFDQIVAGWKRVPTVQILQSESQLPASILSEIKRSDISGKVPGVYSTEYGRVFLIADNLSNRKDVALTVAHEIAGHFGLRRLLGDAYAKTMQQIYRGNESVRKKADETMVKEGLSLEVAVEEVLADMAETGVNADTRNALQQIFAAIRKWLRDTLNIALVTDGDVRQLVANARRYVMDGDLEPGKVSAEATSDTVKRQTSMPTFFSALERGFRAAKMKDMPASQWKSWLQSNKGNLGIKDEEIEWTGINEYLELKGKEKLSKEDVLNFIGTNRIRLNDVILSGPGNYISDADLRSRYIEMYEAAGEDMPNDPLFMDRDELLNELGLYSETTGTKHNGRGLVLPGGREYFELVLTEPSARTRAYKSNDEIHFGDVSGGKAIGWIRGNIRKDADGNDVLFLEELQSQRSQDARKRGAIRGDRLPDGWVVEQDERGDWLVFDNSNTQVGLYAKTKEEAIRSALKDGVPDAPFIGDTKAWVGLLLKRAIAYAQENGIDQIAWTTGDQQNERYKLSKFVDTIAYVKDKSTSKVTVSGTKDGREMFSKEIPPSELESVVGKDMADQINNNVGLEIDNEAETSGIIEGADLEVGGDGMREFYDKIVPQVANSVLKKYGGKTEVMNIVVGDPFDGGVIDLSDADGRVVLIRRATGERVGPAFDTDAEADAFRSKVYEAEEKGARPQMGFRIPEKLQEVMRTDGLPLFRRKDYEDQFADLDPAVREMALDKVSPKPPSIRERVEALKPMLGRRIVQGVFDKYRRIRDFSDKAWKMARVSTTSDGAVSTILYYGQVYNDDGALNYREGTKGLRDIMLPLGPEVDRFLMWVAANRAEKLSKEERERYFKPNEIAALKKLNVGTMKSGTARAAVYAKVLQDMNELNRSVLEIAKSTGVLDDAAYKKFASDIWYVPFYRQMDDDGTLAGPAMSAGLTGQEFSKRLRGSERPLNDLMENVLMNWGHIISAAMKNQAALETLKAADQAGGIVERVEPIDAERGKLSNGEIVRLKGSATVMEKGKPVRYFIRDELLMDSLTATVTFQQSNLFLDIARPFKTYFTRFISLSPTYKVNQLIRDSVQSIGLSELDYNPIKNVKTGIKDYYTKRASAMAGGGIFTLGNAFDGDQTANFKRLVDSGVDPDAVLTTPEKTTKFLKRIWDKYDDVSDAMENSNRLALHRKLRETGASQLDAVFAARDLQDFSLQGSWAAIRYLAAVVPYFNARLQGMYKLGRDGLDPVISTLSGEATVSQRQKAAKFAWVAGAVTMAGLALYLSQKDDEDWKKREDWDRDGFFWFKIPGTDTIIRIPKPFEIGAIATIVERATEQMIDDSVEGKVFAKRLLHVLSDNLAMNPLPSEWQVFKPLYELATNKDGFTGRDIETMGMERIDKVERTNQGTSAAAEALGNINWMFANFVSDVTGGAVSPNSASLSPVQYDYLLRGYLGWLGTVIQTASNVATAPFVPGESSRFERVDDFLLVGNFVKTAGVQPSSKYVTDFYDSAKSVAMAASTMQHYINEGQIEKAFEMMQEKGDRLAMSKLYAKATATMATINKQIKAIEKDETLDGDIKRQEIDALRQLRVEYARQVEEMRKQMKKG